MRTNQEPDDHIELDPELETDNQAQPDELGSDPGEVGVDSAGQSGSVEGLSGDEEAEEESVKELAEAGQDFESAAVEGIEDAANHPQRPTHTHEEYGRPDDVPPKRPDKAA